MEWINPNDVIKARYNPRKIGKDKLELLAESIEKIGFIIPIIVNYENKTIVAGHQRTTTARKLGVEKIPAFYIKNIKISDEIVFNQIHNGSEDLFKTNGTVSGINEKEKFTQIDYRSVTIDRNKVNMASVNQICKMIFKYGNVFSSIVCRGKILFQNEYAYACTILRKPINAYICDDNKYDDIVKYFNVSYGEFSYDHLKKNTFVQGLAQLNRDVKNNKKKSILYEKLVLPWLKKNEVNTILDFGCGNGNYINILKENYQALGVEFYNHNRTKKINVSKGNRQIDELIDYINKNGREFDLVVCDSVLNSVDSLKAEKSVMACLNLFSKKDCFIAGITVERMQDFIVADKVGRMMTKLKFLDKDNFTADFRDGQWYYQKYHSEEDVRELAEKSGFEVVDYQVISGTFKVQLRKIRNLSRKEYEEAINFEFNLPLPNDKSYNRHKDMLKALDLM